MFWTYNREVLLFLETECRAEELEAFLIAVGMVMADPIGNSQAWLGKTNWPRPVRFFRFGGCRAFFEYHWTGDEKTEHIKVVACQRSKPRKAK